MKKIAFFCCALLALGLASCDDKSDMGIMQTNPQLPAVTEADLTPELKLTATTLNLNGLTEIDVIDAPVPENLPAGAVVEFEMQLASKADYSDATVLPVVDGKVSAAEWNTYFRSALGKNNIALPNYIRFAAYFIEGTQRVRVGSLDTWYLPKKIEVTPVPFYYEVLTCNADEGDMLMADFGGNGTYQGLVIIDQEFTFTFDGKHYGLDSGSSLVEDGAPCSVNQAGIYVMEFDSAKLSYKATLVRSFGVMGSFNKWAKQVNLTQDGKIFHGVVDFGETLEGENAFKFRMSNNNSLTFGGYQFDLLFGGANLPVPGEGEYEITFDFSTIPYTYSYIKQ